MKASLGVVFSYDPRFDTMDVVFIPEPLDEAATPTDQICGDASVALAMASNWFMEWWQRSRRTVDG